MAFCCELTGKSYQNGHRVSHSCVKTPHKFRPNIHNVGFFSEILNKKVSFRVAASTVRTIGFKNGIDSFLLKQKNKNISKKAVQVKKMIEDVINKSSLSV